MFYIASVKGKRKLGLLVHDLQGMEIWKEYRIPELYFLLMVMVDIYYL
jgi:hypothetical protein